MARGLPGIWSTVLGVPTIFVGLWVYNGWTLLPAFAGIPIAVFGLFIVGMGWYIHLVAEPPGPTMRTGEELIDTRVPTQKGAIARIILGIPFLLVAAGLLFYSTQPYIYPTGAFVIGIFLFGKGLLTYWMNTLTTYYVTSQRVIREFRLFSLARREVPLNKVRAVEEKQSPLESLVRVGNIQVSTGAAGLSVMIRSVDNVREFANELRQLYAEDGVPTRPTERTDRPTDDSEREVASESRPGRQEDDGPGAETDPEDQRVVPSEGDENIESTTRSDDEPPVASEDAELPEDSCSSCGGSLGGSESFCPHCGMDLSAEPECDACGFELVGDETFCPQCGNELE